MADRTEFEEIILNKITRKLRDEFTKDEIKFIYKEQMPKDFEKPCLTVLEYDTQEEHLGNHIARYYVYFDILFHRDFSSTDLTGVYIYMRKYKPRISRVLDYLTITTEETGNRAIKLKKYGFRTFVQDGVGHIMLEYHYLGNTVNPDGPPPLTSITNDININQIN